MANPFHFSKTKHRRNRTPTSFSNYRQFKPDLRIEFNGQCVYCRALERIKGVESFGVDHYRPKKLFPHLSTQYENLFYACNRCNSLKGQFWPNRQEQIDELFIPNPCDHVMFEHLRYKLGEIAPASSAGGFSIERLDLNDPLIVEFRDGFITMLAKLSSEERAANELVKLAVRRRAEAATQSEIQEAEDCLQLAIENHAEAVALIQKLVGDVTSDEFQAS